MRSTGARLWSTADCVNNHRVFWGNITVTQALYKHGICQTAWWQENHSCTSAVFHKENQNHKSFQRRIALKTCVSIPKAIDTSITVTFFYYLIYFYRTSYDNVVSPSPNPYTNTLRHFTCQNIFLRSRYNSQLTWSDKVNEFKHEVKEIAEIKIWLAIIWPAQ